MGRIFGISDLPVSTIMTALEEVRVPEPAVKQLSKSEVKLTRTVKKDIFIPENSDNTTKKSNPILKMRNGFGKLMKHFSHKAE